MKYSDLLAFAHTQPLIETRSLVALGEKPAQLAVQLTRFANAGKLMQLRRGLYLLPERLRGREVPVESAANLLLRPSYVSLEYALAFHGLIPETVHLVQSVTTRRPASFHTPIGDFRFHYVQPRFFFGYLETEVPGGRAFVARPEKALVDLIHLQSGEWDRPRLEGLRLQNLEIVDAGLLLEIATQMKSPRVLRAVRRLCIAIADERGVAQDPS